MKYAAKRSLRERLYRASSSRASAAPYDNEEIIKEILAIRKEMSLLLGFETYAQVSISKKMAPSVAEVEKMHDDLREKCFEIGKQEIETLAAYAAEHGHKGELAPWDLSYWSEKLKAEKYLFSDEAIKPYFPLEKVLSLSLTRLPAIGRIALTFAYMIVMLFLGCRCSTVSLRSRRVSLA